MTGLRPSRLTGALVDLGLLGCSLIAGLAGQSGLFMAFAGGAAAAWWLNTRLHQLRAIWTVGRLRMIGVVVLSILLIVVVHAAVFVVGAYIHERLT